MDIAGAKALKDRLGGNGADDAPAVYATSAEGAPPVYHWLGVGKARADVPPAAADAPSARRSWLRRRRAELR